MHPGKTGDHRIIAEIAQQFLRSKMIYGLVFLVIVINGAAVYANHQVRTQSTELKTQLGLLGK